MLADIITPEAILGEKTSKIAWRYLFRNPPDNKLDQLIRQELMDEVRFKKKPRTRRGFFRKAFRLFANDANEFTVVFAFNFELNFTVS